MINLNYQDNISQITEYIADFTIFKNGTKIKVGKADKFYNDLICNIEGLFSLSRVMPAFGVSLHDETLNELQNGEWIQINFNKEIEKNGLPFNALLFKLEVTGGMNLIRLYNNKYEGRCIFIEFNEILDLQQIFNISWQNIIFDLELH